MPRNDLRALPTFTIDPPTARDFDDAISAERLDGGAVRVWVHIADVAAHVPPGSAVDREAYRRATSVYVPGKVEPMLPEALSNDACSLVPHQDRLAVTVELELDGATLVRSAFHRSLIRSDARLDYPRVDRIFAGAERAEEPWAAPLEAARAAAAALDAARAARGALAVESVEPEFDFSHEGHVTGLAGSKQTESHRLIEHLMIAANEAVAALLEARKLPALYRVHERPEPARVERLVEQLAALDVPTPPLPEAMTPQQAGDVVGEISRLVDAHVRRTGRGRAALTSLVLRSLKQAHYSARNAGHHGLQSPRYCHFTSPIRRYPDLICHRALLAAIGAGEDPPPANSIDEAARVVLDARARRRGDRARRRRRRAHVPARVRAVRARLGDRVAGRGDRRDRRGRVRRVRRRPRRAAAGAAAARRLVGARRARGDAGRRAVGQGDPARRPGRRAGRARRPSARARRPLARRVVGRSPWPDIATNKRASYRYHLLEKWEAGLVLTGTEVKSLRGGKAQLKDGYAQVQDGEVWLHNVHIPPYAPATRENHEPERPRKLLMHKREIDRLIGSTREKGLTLVPTRLYFKGPRAKVEIALARGKDVGDKRQTIKEREMKREMERAIRRR